jgi:S-DNA-T family DNA segregation ATPase FtsK/SpoIIIE
MDQIEVEMARAAKQDRKGDDFDIGDEDEGGEDPKFVEAVELSIQAQKVATSLLQRRLGVGYGRAAKIIDRMEELGLVSAAEGNKPRKILPAAQGYLEHIGAMSADDDDFGDDYS